MDDFTIRRYAEAIAMRVTMGQLLAFLASQQDDREVWLANMREAALRSLDHSLEISGGGVDPEVLALIREVATGTIGDTFDKTGRAA